MENIFKHYKHTGTGQTIGMYNIFEDNAKAGTFYQTEKGWKCCGEMIRQLNGTVTFTVWIDDSMTKEIQEGPKIGQEFKLLVYQDGMWFEIIPTRVRLAFGGDKNFKPDYFRAKAWNMMAVMKKEHIKLLTTKIIPIDGCI